MVYFLHLDKKFLKVITAITILLEIIGVALAVYMHINQLFDNYYFEISFIFAWLSLVMLLENGTHSLKENILQEKRGIEECLTTINQIMNQEN